MSVGQRMAAMPLLQWGTHLDTVPPFSAQVHVRWTCASPECTAATSASLDDWLTGSAAYMGGSASAGGGVGGAGSGFGMGGASGNRHTSGGGGVPTPWGDFDPNQHSGDAHSAAGHSAEDGGVLYGWAFSPVVPPHGGVMGSGVRSGSGSVGMSVDEEEEGEEGGPPHARRVGEDALFRHVSGASSGAGAHDAASGTHQPAGGGLAGEPARSTTGTSTTTTTTTAAAAYANTMQIGDTCTVCFTIGNLQLQPSFSSAHLLRTAVMALTEGATLLTIDWERETQARRDLVVRHGWLPTAGVRPFVLLLEQCVCQGLSVVVVDDRVGNVGQQVFQVGCVLGEFLGEFLGEVGGVRNVVIVHCAIFSFFLCEVVFLLCGNSPHAHFTPHTHTPPHAHTHLFPSLQVVLQDITLTMQQETCLYIPEGAEGASHSGDPHLWHTARMQSARIVTNTNVTVGVALQVLFLNSAVDSVDRMVDTWPVQLVVERTATTKRVVLHGDVPLEVTLTPMALR